jgi:hypothetical protein
MNLFKNCSAERAFYPLRAMDYLLGRFCFFLPLTIRRSVTLDPGFFLRVFFAMASSFAFYFCLFVYLSDNFIDFYNLSFFLISFFNFHSARLERFFAHDHSPGDADEIRVGEFFAG